MPAPRLPLPLPDYQRIVRVLKSVLDSAGIVRPRADVFFSIAGAALLREVYRKNAQAVAGSAHYKVDDASGTVLLNPGMQAAASADTDVDTALRGHCWVLCEQHVIDFMAPLFPESLAAGGGTCSRRMFQKPLAAMADSPLRMPTPGDFYLLPDVELTKQVLREHASQQGNPDLAAISRLWYRKPPRELPRELGLEEADGSIRQLPLVSLALVGAW